MTAPTSPYPHACLLGSSILTTRRTGCAACEWESGRTTMRYNDSARRAYVPPPCPDCGTTVTQSWVDISRAGDPERMFTPGRWVCPTAGCPKAEVP